MVLFNVFPFILQALLACTQAIIVRLDFMPNIWMIPYQHRQEGIQQDKRCTEAGIRNDGQNRSKYIYLGNSHNEEHGRYCTRDRESQEQKLPISAVVCSTGHGYYQERLKEYTEGECIHRERGGIHVPAEELKDALVPVAMRNSWLELEIFSRSVETGRMLEI